MYKHFTFFCVVLCSVQILFAQLPVENYFQVDEDYKDKEHTLFEFSKVSADSLLYFENQAINYIKTLDPHRDRFKLAAAYNYIANINYNLKRDDIALTYLYKLYELPDFTGTKGDISARWDILKIYRFSENYFEQFKQIDLLMELGKINEFYQETDSINLIKTKADAFVGAGFYNEAREYFTNYIIKDSLAVNPIKYAVILNDLAYIFEKLNQPDSVAKYRRIALRTLNSKRHNPYGEVYKLYIRDYIRLHDYKFYKVYNEESLKFALDFLKIAKEKFEGEIHSAVFACHFLAEFYFYTDNAKEALAYINQALILSENKVILKKLQEYFTLKARILDELGQKEASTQVLQELNTIEYQKAVKNRTLELIEYDVSKIKGEKEKVEFEAIQTKTKYNYTLTISIFLVVLVVIISLAFYVTRQKNKRIKKAREIIAVELKQKEFLLKELNHRVKNNLALITSLVQFQHQDVKEIYAKEKFKELELRINTITMAYEQLVYSEIHTAGEFYHLETYLENVCKPLISISTRKIQLKLNIESIEVNFDTALPIGILINELLSNSIKHAKLDSQTLDVVLNIYKKDNSIHLDYKDSGNGFETKTGNDSLGLIIIESMVQQLSGSLYRKKAHYDIVLEEKI